MNVGEREQVGEKLPKGWKWVRLGDICEDIYRYPSFYGIQHLPSGIPVIRGEHIGKNGEISTSWETFWFVSNEVSEKFPRTILKKDDLVFTVRGTIGKVGIIRNIHIGSQISPNLIRISPLKTVNSVYLWYYLQSIKGGKNRVEDNAVTIATVKASDIVTLPVPLPPLPEQKRIVDILTDRLSTIDKARTATETQLEAAKALPAAYLREVFDSPEARKWKRTKLGDIALVSGGLQKTPHRSPSSFHRSYLTVRNVQRGWLDLSSIERFEITPDELERCRLEYGDLLIVEGNGSPDQVGRNAIYQGEPEDCIHQNHLIRVRLDHTKDDPSFLSFYLNSDFGKKQMLEKAMTTTGLHTLSVSKIQQMEAPIVALEEQRKITLEIKDRLATLTTLDQSLQSQLDTINKLPAALLRQAFNGEL